MSLGAAINAQTTILIGCNFLVPFNLGLDAGQWGGSVATRKMKGGLGANLISYGLYQDAAHTKNWGNTVGVDTVASFGFFPFFSTTFNVYGQVPVQVTPPNGGYSDNVRIVVTY